MARCAELKPGETVLDPMCGKAVILVEAALSWPLCHYLGVDIDADQLTGANSNAFLAHASGARLDCGSGGQEACSTVQTKDLLQGDACKLPLPDASVDVVICDIPYGRQYGTIEECRDTLYKAILKELDRVIQRGPAGRAILISSLEQEPWVFKEAQLESTEAVWRCTARRELKLGFLDASMFVLRRRVPGQQAGELPELSKRLSYQPGRVLGIDLFYIAAPGGGKMTTPILNMVDWRTNYQMCEMLKSKGPEEVWDTFMSIWVRTFGHPEVVVCDAGRQFMGEFNENAAAEGMVVHQIASKAPWQAKKTERHGGHFKELLDKAHSEIVVQEERDLRRLMMEVEQAKNRYSNRSEFSPIQRQIGQWPRLPTAILSDEGIDPLLINGLMVDDIEKLHEMRRVAYKASCEYNARQSWKKAMRARPRTWTKYKAGEYVFAWVAEKKGQDEVDLRMMATVGDLRNAFCQSKPLVRPNGPLYFQQLKEGVVGLHPEQIVRIINGCYGLIDAPLHWRRSLTEDLKALGYESSALDPCIFKLYGSKRKNLLGAIAIEVDDLFTVGHQAHHEKMKKLQEKYKFGKYVTLKEEKEGAAFNGRRIKQTPDGGFLIDMQKFVEERLRPVPLKKGRKSAKKEAVNEAEKNAARATCGALNWLSKEGRPDAAGPSSLMASKLNRLTIEDITQLNAVVKDLKEHSKLSLRIQPLAKMKLSVVTDASYANNGFHSQGGHLVIAHESHLRDGVPAPTNILAWRSAKLQRVVNSTMAAETQSLSKGLAELTWTMLLMKELSDGTLNIRDWREHLKTEELMVISSEETESELRESLAVIDAKSLYDHLTRETIGGSDKRTAIEIQIIRDDLRRLQGQVKWVEHLAMIADGLTKINGSNAALREVIRSGFFGIRPVESAMTLRDAAKKAGHSSAELRRIGTHNILGCCETGNDGMSMLGTNPSSKYQTECSLHVETFLQKISSQDDIYTYNSLINACVESGETERAEHWLEQIRLRRLQPNRVSFSSLVKGAARIGDVEEMQTWFDRMWEAGIEDEMVDLLPEGPARIGCHSIGKAKAVWEDFSFTIVMCDIFAWGHQWMRSSHRRPILESLGSQNGFSNLILSIALASGGRRRFEVYNYLPQNSNQEQQESDKIEAAALQDFGRGAQRMAVSAGAVDETGTQLPETRSVTEESEVLELLVNRPPALASSHGDMVFPLLEAVQPYVGGAHARLMQCLDPGARPLFKLLSHIFKALGCLDPESRRRPNFASVVRSLHRLVALNPRRSMVMTKEDPMHGASSPSDGAGSPEGEAGTNGFGWAAWWR
eukprot:g6630.t1